jgi:hypothetical protein
MDNKNADTMIPQIKVSNDYESFKIKVGNRKQYSAHVKRLIASIEKRPHFTRFMPIIVTDNLFVIDGQHRLGALKKLGLPVHYIQVNGLSLADAQVLNSTSKPWTPNDYAQSYATLGNKNYQIYLDLKKKYGLNHDVLLKFISLDLPITGTGFRDGDLIAANYRKTVNLIRELMEVGKFYKDRYKTRSFALGFKIVWESPKYDHANMMILLGRGDKLIIDAPLPIDYARQLASIYNQGVKPGDKIEIA